MFLEDDENKLVNQLISWLAQLRREKEGARAGLVTRDCRLRVREMRGNDCWSEADTGVGRVRAADGWGEANGDEEGGAGGE